MSFVCHRRGGRPCIDDVCRSMDACAWPPRQETPTMPEPADIIAGYHHTGQVDTDAVNDMARRVTQARDRVVEAAKAIRNCCVPHWPTQLPLRVERELVAAVDALEEAERGA